MILVTQNERLLFLIEYLTNESDKYRGLRVPDSIEEKKALFRSLVNIREPKPVSKEFLAVQDEFL